MNVDTFLIRIILLVIPGLAGYKTFRTIQSTGKSRKQIKDWQDFLTITFLSVLSYGLLFVVYQIIVLVAALSSKQGVSLTVTSIDALIDVGIKINFFEIVYASLIAMLVGLLAGVLYNKKTLYKLARFLRITKHYGDDDVWSFVTNPDDVEWLFVRDHKVDLVYYGSLAIFSESDEKRELLLQDVDVFSNADGSRLYHTDSMYICREDNELTLEIPTQVRYLDGSNEEAGHVRQTPRSTAHSGRHRQEGRHPGSPDQSSSKRSPQRSGASTKASKAKGLKEAP